MPEKIHIPIRDLGGIAAKCSRPGQVCHGEGLYLSPEQLTWKRVLKQMMERCSGELFACPPQAVVVERMVEEGPLEYSEAWVTVREDCPNPDFINDPKSSFQRHERFMVLVRAAQAELEQTGSPLRLETGDRLSYVESPPARLVPTTIARTIQ